MVTGPGRAQRVAGSLPYLLPPLVLSAWAYAPITRNYFHGDDFQHLYLIADGRIAEFLVTLHGGHMLPARNALFVLEHALFGLDPRGYFWIALLTHLGNVGLLFAVIAAFTRDRRIAGAGAALWGASALNVEALGWYSVYGQVVLTTLLLIVLRGLARAVRDDAPVSSGAALGWFALMVAGSTCFGIGIGFALASVVAVALLLPEPRHRSVRHLFAALLIVVPGLYVLVQMLFFLLVGHAHDSATYARDALGAGLAISLMTVHLMAFGIAKTLVEPWLPGAPYPGALLGAVAAAYALAMVVAWAAADRATRRALLACLVLAAGGYGIIAVGRALVAPEALSLLGAAAAQTRYHYAAPVPLLIAGCLALAVAARALSALPRWAGDAAAAAWIGALALVLAARPPAIDHYDAERREVAAMHDLVAAQVARAAPGAPVYVDNRPMTPLNYFARMETFPGWAGLFVLYFPDNRVDGHAVHFVDASAERVALARRRPHSRTADLLVTRAESGGAARPGASNIRSATERLVRATMKALRRPGRVMGHVVGLSGGRRAASRRLQHPDTDNLTTQQADNRPFSRNAAPRRWRRSGSSDRPPRRG